MFLVAQLTQGFTIYMNQVMRLRVLFESTPLYLVKVHLVKDTKRNTERKHMTHNTNQGLLLVHMLGMTSYSIYSHTHKFKTENSVFSCSVNPELYKLYNSGYELKGNCERCEHSWYLYSYQTCYYSSNAEGERKSTWYGSGSFL